MLDFRWHGCRGCDRHHHRVVAHANRLFQSRGRDRRRKRQQLAILLCCLDNCRHADAVVVIQQPVRLVQHNGLYGLGIDLAFLNQFQDPPARPDQQVRSVFQSVNLSGNIHIADDYCRRHRQAGVVGQQLRLAKNLHRQFMRRRQHDRLRISPGMVDLLKQRQ